MRSRYASPARLPGSIPALFALLTLALSATACRTGAKREWRPEDHDDEMPGGGQVAPPPSGSSDDGRALVEAAWTSRCSVCHGRYGAGDGPQGMMVKASDLTDPKFQDRATDDDIAKVIRTGRNKMPGFPDLPGTVVTGLVKRIRAVRAK